MSHQEGRKVLTSGEVQGTSGELSGESEKLSEHLWTALKLHIDRSSRAVAGELPGKWGEILGSPGTFQKLLGVRLPPSETPKLSPNL